MKEKIIELVEESTPRTRRYAGNTTTYILSESGAWRKPTLWDRIKMLRQRLLWWRVEKVMVIEANPETGIVTLIGLTWSWRKWKWVAP